MSTTAERVNSAPQTMQWAVRSRTKPGRGGSGADPAGSGNFIYIDPNLRRNPPGGGGKKNVSLQNILISFCFKFIN